MADYQLADQYLLDASKREDAPVEVSRGKKMAYVPDNNQGSYSSGIITIDAASQLQGSKGFASLKDAYITLPYVVTMKNLGSDAFAKAINRYCVGMKAGVWNVVDSLTVTLNGTIFNQN